MVKHQTWQGTGGNVVVISSKNVFDPGAVFGAYSASKAGAHQISKIATLELAPWVSGPRTMKSEMLKTCQNPKKS
jgi:NAD(P)-dependent dehydrogenase (short-subunit alcohol dehydrogenase family)